MIETFTYKNVLPSDVLEKYEFFETRSATKIAEATSPRELADIIRVLRAFSLSPELLLSPGGNRGVVPAVLDGAFGQMGWEEARVDTARQVYFFPGHSSKHSAINEPERYREFLVSETYQTGYSVDNVKGTVALDVEWNPKDGNLDRDFSAYRAWYDESIIDVAFLITRIQSETKALAKRLWDDYVDGHPAASGHKQPVTYGTTTTANFEKAVARITRGDLGRCPILMIGIGEKSWTGSPWDGVFVRYDKSTGKLLVRDAFTDAATGAVYQLPL